MKMMNMKCPNCGGELEVEDGLETFFCKYCGHRIILSGQSNAVIGAKVVNRILEHREHIAQMKIEEDRAKREEALKERKRNDKIVFFGILAFLLFGVTLLIIASIMEGAG